MRTREQNEALEKERLSAQWSLDQSKRIADEQQCRAPARRAQLAAAARAKADNVLRRPGSASGHDSMQQPVRPHSAGPTSQASVPHTAQRITPISRSQDEVFRRLQEQSNAVAQRAEAVLSRSEQLAQTFDPMNSERDASAMIRPQTAPATGPQHPAQFLIEKADLQQPTMSQSSAEGAIEHEVDSYANAGNGSTRRMQPATATENSSYSNDHAKQATVVDDSDDDHHYTDEALATGAYSDARYAAYSQDLNLDMQLRFASGAQADDVERGFESDIERDAVQQQQTAAAQAANMLLLQGVECKADTIDTTDVFLKDNAWMDEYRKGVVNRCAQ
jgi:hypothetical protein